MTFETNPFASEEITPPISEEWDAKRRAARALRKLNELLVTSSPDSGELGAVTDRLESCVEALGNSPRIFGRFQWSASGEHGSFRQINHELSPVVGQSNALAPAMNTWLEGDRALGTCTCGWAYEGPPGSVHGGFIAAIFDHFLGVAQLLGERAGMTGYLHVDYHKPTPLNTELQLEAELLGNEGRKTLFAGKMFAGDTLTASCEGLFIEPRQGLFGPQDEARGGKG